MAKPVAKRGVYMDFAAQGKKPGPVVLRPDARAAQRQAARPAGPDMRAAQANARIAQRKAQAEAQQRAMRLAKAGVPGRAPGLTTPVRQVAQTQRIAQPQRVAQPRAVQPKTAQPETAPKRPLSRGRIVKPRGAAVQYSGATIADAQAAVKAAQAKQAAPKVQAIPRVQRTGVTVAQVADTPAGRLIEQETYEEIDFGLIEDYQGDATTGATLEVAKEPEKGPNWPFLKSVTVEKRPLSGKKPVPTKTVAPRPTTVTPAASSIALNSGVARKGSKLPMVGLVVLTIILGVAVGAAVYFAIFQGGGPE